MNYDNLRAKTIFDLCEDVAYIQEFIPAAGSPDFDREEYRRFCMANPTSNALHMNLLSSVLCDNQLARAVQEEFAAELNAFFAAQ